MIAFSVREVYYRAFSFNQNQGITVDNLTKRADKVERLKRGIYLLPNLLTTGALFSGFYAIMAAVAGEFSIAAIAIFVAMILDTLDGRVARLTKTSSAFGAEYDSLSDMVAFGVAPSLLVYSWSLHALGKFGWLAAFVFTVAVALRLARFNTRLEETDKRYFQGLPCPAGAAIITAAVWLGTQQIEVTFAVSVVMACLSVLVAAAMVSNLRFPSFKELDFKGRVPFVTLLLAIVVLVAVSLYPPLILFGVFSCYGIAGVVTTLRLRRKIRVEAKSKK